MKIEQHGKSSASLVMQKKSFFIENDKHVKKQRKIADTYAKQPRRINCKNCNGLLSQDYDFIKDMIEYKICNNCSHLNGANEDTNEFCEAIYTKDSGESYAESYEEESIEDYNRRVSSIYIPKADFLVTALINNGEHPDKLKYLDFGAGSGYFTAALKKIGLTNVFGSEVSKCQVEFGNRMNNSNTLSVHEISNTNKVLQNTDANVVSMIGVLEHLQNPREVMNYIKSNPNVSYLYISVPLFSLSVYLEMSFPNVFHRQLHGGHTHLYTENSLNYMCDEFGFDIIAQWWFGTDIVDLYRDISIIVEKNHASNKLINTFKEMIIPVIDSMQFELDKKHLSSEVHLLLKKK
ncbi:class I SAM-dependent methyltransferase [Methanolobus psychrotolerans]|uniref:class I SAM-dependent methyltransferase n=1 Tax=Methanolobus psychrotolerans TaxID=1874706 RepID=UPI000B918EBD|nr:class I SAM-dependent methyltransferase [Methanolobus psychrotolerans]